MTIYYIDNLRGNNSNNGTSIATAWKDLTQITTVSASPGDQFLLANDSVWEYDIDTRIVIPVTWTGTETNPVIIDKYLANSDTKLLPTIIWGRTLLSSDWTYNGTNNAWEYTAPFSVGNYCMVRLNNTWNASRVDGTQLPLASINGRYSNNSTSFYLYAPASIDPTKYYGSVRLGLSDTAFFTVSTGRGFVTFKNLKFTNSGTGILCYNNTTTANGVVIDGCVADTVSHVFYSVAENAAANLSFTVKNCVITNWGSVAIQSYNSSSNKHKKVHIYNNYIHDGMNNYSQGALYLQCSCTQPGLIYNNVISKVKFGTLGKESDGCAIYCETSSNNVRVFQNIVYDCHIALQDNSGRTNYWYSNIVYDCQTAMKISDQNVNNLMNCSVYNNTFIVGKQIPAEYGTGDTGQGIRVFMETSGTLPSIYINNNIIVNTGDTFIAAIRTANENPVAYSYDNNLCYNYTNVARREYLGTNDTANNSVTTNPQLTATFYPKNTSPTIAAGKVVPVAVDFNGAAWTSSPTIGAYQYIAPRATATNRGTR